MVAVDTTSEFTQFTTASPATATHTPGAAPDAVAVVIANNGTVDDLINGVVSYGGVTMTRVLSFTITSEPGRMYVYFLGSGVPSGAQTVSIAHTGTSNVKWAATVTFTGTDDMEVVDSDAGSGTSAISVTLDSGDRVAVRVGIGFSASNSPGNITPISGYTFAQDHDFGPESGALVIQTTPADGDVAIGYTGQALEHGLTAIAVTEVLAGPTGLETAAATEEDTGRRLNLTSGDAIDVTAQAADEYDTGSPLEIIGAGATELHWVPAEEHTTAHPLFLSTDPTNEIELVDATEHDTATPLTLTPGVEPVELAPASEADESQPVTIRGADATTVTAAGATETDNGAPLNLNPVAAAVLAATAQETTWGAPLTLAPAGAATLTLAPATETATPRPLTVATQIPVALILSAAAETPTARPLAITGASTTPLRLAAAIETVTAHPLAVQAVTYTPSPLRRIVAGGSTRHIIAG